jgi:oxygen-dependent protoporphyrinogen oxidase
MVGGARAPGLVEGAAEGALAAVAISDLRTYIPLPDPLGVAVVPRLSATPQPETGHAGRVAKIRALAARHEGLSLVSAAPDGPGIAGCVAQAARFGETLAASGRPAQAHDGAAHPA